MYRSGLSCAGIARELEMQDNTVRRILCQEGVITRAKSERDTLICQAYESGVPRSEIAEAWGISMTRVWQIANANGVSHGTVRPKRERDVLRESARQLYRAGVMPKEIASRLGLSISYAQELVSIEPAHRPKVTQEQAFYALRRLLEGWTQEAIGLELGIATNTIHRVKANATKVGLIQAHGRRAVRLHPDVAARNCRAYARVCGDDQADGAPGPAEDSRRAVRSPV